MRGALLKYSSAAMQTSLIDDLHAIAADLSTLVHVKTQQMSHTANSGVPSKVSQVTLQSSSGKDRMAYAWSCSVIDPSDHSPDWNTRLDDLRDTQGLEKISISTRMGFD